MLADEHDEIVRFPKWLRAFAMLAVMLPMVAVPDYCRVAQAQIKVPPEVSAGQPLVAEVSFPDAPEGATPTDLLWTVGDAGYLPISASVIHIWPALGTNDKQLTITVSGGLVTADGKYVPKSNQRFQATLLVRGVLPSPPGPKPDPKPDDPLPVPDGEAPIKEPGMRVLITYESSKGYPSWLSDRDFTDFLTSVCVVGKTGYKEWRMTDPDSPTMPNAGVWPAALAKMQGKEVPGILISNGKNGTIEKLPATKADTIALIKKYTEGK